MWKSGYLVDAVPSKLQDAMPRCPARVPVELGELRDTASIEPE